MRSWVMAGCNAYVVLLVVALPKSEKSFRLYDLYFFRFPDDEQMYRTPDDRCEKVDQSKFVILHQQNMNHRF